MTTSTVPDASPARLAFEPPEAAVMTKHALHSPTLPPSGYLKVGSVVPWSAPVLTWDDQGVAAGLIPDPTVIPEDVAAWAKKELAHLPGRKPIPWPGPGFSGLCKKTWDAKYGLKWMCTLPKGHADDIQCEALGETGAVLASPTEALVTEALKPAPRKRTRTVRKVEVA